jgi:hypothetical protein
MPSPLDDVDFITKNVIIADDLRQLPLATDDFCLYRHEVNSVDLL